MPNFSSLIITLYRDDTSIISVAENSVNDLKENQSEKYNYLNIRKNALYIYQCSVFHFESQIELDELVRLKIVLLHNCPK